MMGTFKVWDKDKRVLATVASIDYEEGIVYYYSPEQGERVSVFKDDCVLLPMTGVRDKYLRPIYRGDIVRFPKKEDELDTINLMVEWDDWNGSFCLVEDTGVKHIVHDEKYRISEAWDVGEVIGNIFEDRELFYPED